MRFIRALIREDRLLAATILAMALAVKLFVPAGYMIGGSAAHPVVEICSAASEILGASIMPDGNHGTGDHSDRHDQPCAFTALAMASLAGADAPLLALALAFILLVGLLPERMKVCARPARLRPPPRAPPLIP